MDFLKMMAQAEEMMGRVQETQEAQRKARALAEQEMRKVAGGLGFGGLPFTLPF